MLWPCYTVHFTVLAVVQCMSCVSPLSLTCIVSKYLWKYSQTFFLAWRPSHSSTLSQMTLLNWKGNTLNGACNRDGQGKKLSNFWPIFRYIWETVQGGSVVIMEYGTLIGSRMVFFKLCHFWRMTLSDPIIGVCVCVCVCVYVQVLYKRSRYRRVFTSQWCLPSVNCWTRRSVFLMNSISIVVTGLLNLCNSRSSLLNFCL